VLQRGGDFFTRAQIAGMPVEATSHANTLSSIVGSVPGEKDAVGRILAAITWAWWQTRSDPRNDRHRLQEARDSRAREPAGGYRGAARDETKRGGLVNSRATTGCSAMKASTRGDGWCSRGST
jgi:hypothetical protein